MNGRESDKRILHVKFDRETVRLIDHYAAEHDLYRNEAAALLLTMATQQHLVDGNPKALSDATDDSGEPE